MGAPVPESSSSREVDMEDMDNFFCSDFATEDFIFCVPEGMTVPLSAPVEPNQEARK